MVNYTTFTADAALRLEAKHCELRIIDRRIFVPRYLSEVSKLTKWGLNQKLSLQQRDSYK